MTKETALFAAGCFWGVEAAFRATPGVTDTRAGYAGGTATDPNYQQVCTGNTGHAETVKIEFDTDQVSYAELLEVFWDNHDPTTPNRQGPDIGTQYRSAIFVMSDEQDATARESKAGQNQSGRFRRQIVTEIVPANQFFDAEEYHQRYFEKQGWK